MHDLESIWNIGPRTFRALLEGAAGRRTPGRFLRALARFPGSGGAGSSPRGGRIDRAVKVERPQWVVWPWLCQMMRGGGIYGWPALEKSECRSAEIVLQGSPPPREGDRLGELLVVDAVFPLEGIRWRGGAELHFLGVRLSALTLHYSLARVSNGRSILESRLQGECAGVTSQIERHVLEALDFVLPLHQLLRVRRCAESFPACAPGGESDSARSRCYQHLPLHSAGAAGQFVRGT